MLLLLLSAAVCSTQADARTRQHTACGCQQTGFLLCLRACWRAGRRNAQGCRVAGFVCAQHRWFQLAHSHPVGMWPVSERAAQRRSAQHAGVSDVGALARAGDGGCKLDCREAGDERAVGQGFKTRSLPTVSLYPGVFPSSPFCSSQTYACSHIYMYIPYTSVHIYLYIHTCINTHMHTYIHTYIHAYIHTSMHTYIHTYIHLYLYTCVHIHTYISTSIYISA